MEELNSMGEKKIVASLIRMFDPEGQYMLGDDCGVIDIGKDYLLITTDMINQRTHIPQGATPQDIGWYAAAINLSDIAAMGGRPLGLLFAFGLPPDSSFDILVDISKGIQECCSRYAVPTLGGDTKETDTLTITGTGIGTVSKRAIMWRKGANPGDVVAMTGRLGRPLKSEKDSTVSNSLLRIEPRLKEGQILGASGAVTSCIDISDGLSTSLHHLAEESGKGFEIYYESLPWLKELSDDERELALHCGGEYELLFTMDPKHADRVFDIGRGDTAITRIGVVTDEINISIIRDEKREILPDKGYEHFGGSA
jgi:thiamine-monophosphate kinase